MAGWRAALQAPARQLGVERQEGIGSHVCRRLQALVQTEHQQRGPAAETGLHHACADLGHLIDGERARRRQQEDEDDAKTRAKAQAKAAQQETQALVDQHRNWNAMRTSSRGGWRHFG